MRIRLFPLTLLIAATMAGAARGQLSQEVLQQHPPLSYPMWLKLKNSPEAVRALMSPLPSSEPGSASRPAPSEQTTPPDPTSPWSLVTPLGRPASNPLLLTDGTVIVHVSETRTWWRLTPSIFGDYATGTWSQIASLPIGYAPRFFASAVLADGRVIVEGGEYNNPGGLIWTNLGAIYDPIADSWTPVIPPNGWANIGDAQSVVLPDGTFMLANALTQQQALLDANFLTWTPTGSNKFDRDANDEEGWTLLPDETPTFASVLIVDAYVGTGTCDSNSELLGNGNGMWRSAGSTIARLPDCGPPNFSFEVGPQVLRPDRTVIAFGGITSGADPTAIFDTTTLSWSVGPIVPPPYTLADAPAALLPSGNVLFAASPGLFQPPSAFFEVAKGTNVINQVADDPDQAFITSYRWNFLVLPTGQILATETDFNNIWIYTPSGTPDPAWAPHIDGYWPYPIVYGGGPPNAVFGSQFNGLSQGAAYGDDVQAATNYPLVRIVNNESGQVTYARTFDHSSMGISRPDGAAFTHFTVPRSTPEGASCIYVVVNGIESNCFPTIVVDIPVIAGSE